MFHHIFLYAEKKMLLFVQKENNSTFPLPLRSFNFWCINEITQPEYQSIDKSDNRHYDVRILDGSIEEPYIYKQYNIISNETLIYNNDV